MRLDKLLEQVEVIKTNCPMDLDITDIALTRARPGPAALTLPRAGSAQTVMTISRARCKTARP